MEKDCETASCSSASLKSQNLSQKDHAEKPVSENPLDSSLEEKQIKSTSGDAAAFPQNSTSSQAVASIDIDEHKIPSEEVCQRYGTDFNSKEPFKSFGLSKVRAAELLKVNGKNCLSPPAKSHPILVYFKHLFQIFNLFLLSSGLLSFLLFALHPNEFENLSLAIVLMVVAFLNAFIEFFQVYRTSAILESFNKLLPANAMVLREGMQEEIKAEELVSGDLILVRTGQKASADMRILWASDGLKVDNSSITGESEPQDRFSCDSLASPLEATNLIFNGSLIVAGEAIGLVIRTGDKSILGQIAGLATSGTKRESQLSREIDLFVKKMGLIALFFVILFIIIGRVQKIHIQFLITSAIGLFVAFVPQGLPLTVSTLLSSAAKQLAKVNVLVKELHSVETLGSITMLASDKTGTLTQNKMTAVSCWINTGYYAVADGQDIASHEKLLQKETPNASTLVSACCLCSKAAFDDSPEEVQKPLKDRHIFGDATESGLLRFAANRMDIVQERVDHPKVYEIPFSSATKWHLTIHEWKKKKNGGNSNFRIYLKGAPERVIGRCTRILKANAQIDEQANREIGEQASQQIDEQVMIAFNSAYETYASNGQRVLAFAYLDLPVDQFPEGFAFEGAAGMDKLNFPIEGLTFVGLVALMDPPKRGVRKAIAACRTAGIQVVMVTGDHPLTAEAIARKIGIIQGTTKPEAAKRLQKPLASVAPEEYDAVVIHGEKISTMSDEDWDLVFSKREIVFARTTPQQKLEIVTRGQAKGHIVGVSGDGVNDSPALKKADLGISMNKSASDVSKEAAGMILLDDNFVSIVQGIHLGRIIFTNLKKSIRYTLTHMTPEILSICLFVILKMPPLISPLLVLCIDLGTELVPAISFAYEPAEKDLMLMPPRKVLCKENLNWGSFERTRQASQTERKNWFQKLVFKFKEPFLRNETGETLVDNDLLIWCYLEGGLIILIGCFLAYLYQMWLLGANLKYLFGAEHNIIDRMPFKFSDSMTIFYPESAKFFLGRAQAAFFITIVISQWINLFLQKHRYTFPWGWDMFVNRWTWLGIASGAVISMLLINAPPLQIFVQSYFVSWQIYLFPFVIGVILFVYEVIRRWLRMKGFFGGLPKKNQNLVELIRTTTTIQ